MQPLGPLWSEWAGLNARISADAGAEFPGRMICLKEMAFAYSESARLVPERPRRDPAPAP